MKDLFGDLEDLGDLFGHDIPMREVETTHKISPRKLALQNKRAMISKMKKEKAHRVLEALPAPGEALHIVSNGAFNYWNFVPLIAELSPSPVKDCYFSTWTMNRDCTIELLALLDEGKLERVSLITGLYFKRREAAVYSHLVLGLSKRGMRLRSLENHAKIALMAAPPNYYVMEVSANFTNNPRIEQNVITNDEDLWRFHAEWIEEVLNAE